eukprot:5307487-Heterocapsa_arctica.AAC.1
MVCRSPVEPILVVVARRWSEQAHVTLVDQGVGDLVGGALLGAVVCPEQRLQRKVASAGHTPHKQSQFLVQSVGEGSERVKVLLVVEAEGVMHEYSQVTFFGAYPRQVVA